jgi:Rrf2 family nitric oxide-sensitive transcriptional repressor
VQLTRYTDYGLRVLMLVASRPDETVSTTDLARALRVSRNHLLKVVNRLCELDWLQAKRGPSGGVSFAARSESITVGEIVRTLESQLDLVECFSPRTNTCPLLPACRLAPLLRRAQEAFLAVLDEVTLGDLVARPAELRAVTMLLETGSAGRRSREE